MKGRIRRLQKLTGFGKELPCPECGGRIIYEEIREDGTSSCPDGGPCAACGSRGRGGRIGRIIVDRRGWEEHGTERGFSINIGDLYQVEEGED